MYKAFHLTEAKGDSKYRLIGRNIFTKAKTIVKDKLEDFLLSDKSLNGESIVKAWFPEDGYDVFISHSHKDIGKALTLAGWLYDTFAVKCFIDSCVWGYADNLIKILDDRYCPAGRHNTYYYEKRNYSTVHVHMMLSVALSKMMDKTECVIFIDTPNSIEPNSVIPDGVNETLSPWIYYEIGILNTLRENVPSRIRQLREQSEEEGTQTVFSSSELKIRHKIDLSKIPIITLFQLLDLGKIIQPTGNGNDFLDNLYLLYGR